MDTLISEQLHLWPPLQNLVSLNSHTNSIILLPFSTYKGFLNFVHLES